MMNKDILKKLNITLTEIQEKKFELYENIFLEENAKLNLISKNDEKFLFEKHIFDSLAINLFLHPQKDTKLLDVGTGGGFPAVPVSILYEDIKVYPLDSIKKKINAITNLKNELKQNNLYPICERVENLKDEFDIITTRAVASLDKIIKLSASKLKKGGYFIAYKSLKVNEELEEAKNTIKKSGLKLHKVIEYELPLEEKFSRNLVILKKV